MLYRNRKTDKPIPSPPRMRRVQVDAEAELTDKTMEILRQLRAQFGNNRTAYQMIIDRYTRLVTPKFAYDRRGERDLPVAWVEGRVTPLENWAGAIKLDLSRLLVTYYEAIREGNNGPWLMSIAIWERRLEIGIDSYILVPYGNAGYVLMTKFDAKVKAQNREAAVNEARARKLDEIDARAAARRKDIHEFDPTNPEAG